MFRSHLPIALILTGLLVSCSQGERPPPEVTLEPSETEVAYNGTFVMTWSAKGTKYCVASGDWVGNVKRSGIKTLGPLTKDSEYTLDCYHSGELISKTVSIKVGNKEAPDIRITASPLSIAHNGNTTISWSTQDVSDCQASGAWSGPVDDSGSVEVSGLTADSSFELSCQSASSKVKNSVSVEVFEPGIIVPFVELSASPTQTRFQGSTTLTWTTSGADICRATGGWGGSKARNGSEIIPQLNQDTLFVLSCTRAGDRSVVGRDAVEVTITNPPPSARF